MTSSKEIIYSSLLKEFQNCTDKKLSGAFNIESSKGHKWSFYYHSGRLLWGTTGSHASRRWRRCMRQFCPDLDINNLEVNSLDLVAEYWDYLLLLKLSKQGKIDVKQAYAVAEKSIAEVLFDLSQRAHFYTIQWEQNLDIVLDPSISFASTNLFLKRMDDEWRQWSATGLAHFSPNSAPVIAHPQQLQGVVTPKAYSNFVRLINGNNTLWDLGLRLKQNIVTMTYSLRHYFLKGLMQLVEVDDFPLPGYQAQKPIIKTAPQKRLNLLIVGIDDSPQVGQLLENIITSQGWSFIKIEDALQALPILIEKKPDLIFLDLMMPVANGYEICAQIRRVSALANIPVIILTGNDGLIDRVRAKFVGSNDYITKPVETDKVIGVIRKHLAKQLSVMPI